MKDTITSNNGGKTSWGSGGLFQNRALGSLLLMLTTPIFCMTFWYTCYAHDGSFLSLYNEAKFLGVLSLIRNKIWLTPFDGTVLKMVFCYMLYQLVLMKVVPGKVFYATSAPSGHVPVYKANGIQCYAINILTLFLLHHLKIFDPSTVYDNLGKILSTMNLFAILLCSFLTFKGINFPSTPDSGSNGNIVIDFFWGTELYPRIFGWDVKQFTNCRCGMMFWQLGIICYAFKQYENVGYVSSSMLASVLIQSVYIAKFFWWETGYFCSMDIQHDRAGYYICWGCLVWVPSMYTIHTYFLVNHPTSLTLPATILVTSCGLFCIWCNYDCDRQRQEFRKFGGRQKIWGQDPQFIVAHYSTKDGSLKESLLLTSGWWGLARHFHYIPEVMASVFWVVPTQYEYTLPYFYPIYLTLLLVDRAWRDDARCADKYGADWNHYCLKVPYKVVPGII